MFHNRPETLWGNSWRTPKMFYKGFSATLLLRFVVVCVFLCKVFLFVVLDFGVGWKRRLIIAMHFILDKSWLRGWLMMMVMVQRMQLWHISNIRVVANSSNWAIRLQLEDARFLLWEYFSHKQNSSTKIYWLAKCCCIDALASSQNNKKYDKIMRSRVASYSYLMVFLWTFFLQMWIYI